MRNQCSGFIYALSVADQYIKTGMYKTFCSEVHSTGLDMTSRGRGVSVILEMEQEQPF
jgi:3-oxoacyl-[acyl-carrier-protein] synthase-3